MKPLPPKAVDEFAGLTPQQRYVVYLLMCGCSAKQIARRAGVSRAEIVYRLIGRARKKVGAESTIQLVVIAVLAGMRPADRDPETLTLRRGYATFKP